METRSRWRAGPGRLAVLMLGLVLFGTGEALLVGPLLHETMGAVESVRATRFGRWSRSRSR